MAEWIVRQWELAVLRVRVDVSGTEPDVVCELVDYASGTERHHWSQRHGLTDFGLSSTGGPPDRLQLPPDLVSRINGSVRDELLGETALWLRLEPPYGFLGAVPWETIAKTVGLPVLRVPDRMPVPTELGRTWSVAVAVDAGRRSWGAEHIVALFAELSSRLAENLQMDVFADAHTVGLLAANPIVDPRLRIHRPQDAARVHADREQRGVKQFRGDGPTPPSANLRWADWIADGMAGRAVRALHVVTGAVFDGEVPLLTISADPARPTGKRDCGLVSGTDLGILADALGASLISVGSPPKNPADAATRMLADSVGQSRPGPTLYSSIAADPHTRALAGAHQFLCDPTAPGAEIPSDSSLFGYIQPEAIRPVIAQVSLHAVETPADADVVADSVYFTVSALRTDSPPDRAWSKLSFSQSDPVALHFENAADVPNWVATSSRFLDSQSLSLQQSAAAGPQVPSKAGYDEGAKEALGWIKGLVTRWGGTP